MVVKPKVCSVSARGMFESRVILDGSQTLRKATHPFGGFESRVILDGSQTLMLIRRCPILFESRVILDGSQTLAGTHR